jgi:N-acetylglutamate synthase-like GNAT family acetyltransferase
MSTASASWMRETLWEMNRIIVKPHMRRKGVGTALMKALYIEAKKNGATAIYVIPGGYDITYEEQVAFYKSVGFIDSKYNKEKILARNL